MGRYNTGSSIKNLIAEDPIKIFMARAWDRIRGSCTKSYFSICKKVSRWSMSTRAMNRLSDSLDAYTTIRQRRNPTIISHQPSVQVVQGNTNSQGPSIQGYSNSQGPTGITGIIGYMGVTGYTGIIGYMGVAGIAGNAINFIESPDSSMMDSSSHSLEESVSSKKSNMCLDIARNALPTGTETEIAEKAVSIMNSVPDEEMISLWNSIKPVGRYDIAKGII